MDRKVPKLKKLEKTDRRGLSKVLGGLARPKLSRPFGHSASKQGDSRLAARLEQLLGLSHKERQDSGLRLARTALSTLNLLIGSEQIRISRKRAKRALKEPSGSLTPTATAWMFKTFMIFLRSAGPDVVITQVAFRQAKGAKRKEDEDGHPLANAKPGLNSDKQTSLYSHDEYYRRDGIARLYK